MVVAAAAAAVIVVAVAILSFAAADTSPSPSPDCRRYMRTWFFIDVFSVVPLDYVCLLLGALLQNSFGNSLVDLSASMRLTRMIRFARCVARVCGRSLETPPLALARSLHHREHSDCAVRAHAVSRC